jgi:GNAT superfamily N-acetyltransferase
VHLSIAAVDPQGSDALSLLQIAAREARQLYPELHGPSDPWPTNGPTPPRGACFIAYLEGRAIAMGAHRPLDEQHSEVRRVFTLASARRTGAARQIMSAIEEPARTQGFAELRLETGYKQLPAIALYSALGYRRIEPFGPYKHDPTSVCLAKLLASSDA